MSPNIRNFAIIAHIDAGKSTLADRFLEITHTVSHRQMKRQLLDSNPIERERGITIKLAPVTMQYVLDSQSYTLNLIDTPGHVDFNYEVERSLQACESAILLVDATRGVQAQTIANLKLAQQANLVIIPVINKIDTTAANIQSSLRQTLKLLQTNRQPFLVSAKTGQGVKKLLQAIILQTPAPVSNTPLAQGLIFNSLYHPHLGVIAFVRVFSGQFNSGDNLTLKASNKNFTASEIGIFNPQRQPQTQLSAGSVGYVVTGLKNIAQVQVGDALIQTKDKLNTPALSGFRQTKPNIFFDLFPVNNNRFIDLVDALNKLKLNDAALKIHPVKSSILGQGVRIGFLGLLHAEVVSERLEREFNLSIIRTSPSVEYKAILKNNKTFIFTNPDEFPLPVLTQSIQEQIAHVVIITPPQFVGPIMQTCQNLRGHLIKFHHLDQLSQLEYSLPLIEVISSLHDRLKSISAGFASLDYQPSGWQKVKLVKLSVFFNHQEVPSLAFLTTKDQAQAKAGYLAKKLQKIIPRQQFEIPIQITLNGKIIARETIKAYRKDVTARLYGGDATRRKKLLQKQKRGKAKMKQFGKVVLPPEAFLALVS